MNYHPSGRGGLMPRLSVGAENIQKSKETIASLLAVEPPRPEVLPTIYLCKNGTAIEHDVSLPSGLMNATATSFSSLFSPTLVGTGAPFYSESTLMKAISEGRTLTPLVDLLVTQPSSSILLSGGALLGANRRAQSIVPVYVPTKTDTMYPPRRRRGNRKAELHKGIGFPTKLFFILQQADAEGYEDIISFLPHGKAFMIYKPEKFAQEVMPRYFKSSRLTTFRKQLSLYGFKRIKGGSDHGALFHNFFRRDDQKLVAKMWLRRKADRCGDATTTKISTGEAEGSDNSQQGHAA